MELRYIESNKWYHRLINRLDLNKVTNSAAHPRDPNGSSDLAPLFVTGFFRSGTSLTTHLLNDIGYDLGPEKDLIKAKGKGAELNPEGFYENYLFMDASLFVFAKLNAWGHLPPSKEEVDQLVLTSEDPHQR